MHAPRRHATRLHEILRNPPPTRPHTTGVPLPARTNALTTWPARPPCALGASLRTRNSAVAHAGRAVVCRRPTATGPPCHAAAAQQPCGARCAARCAAAHDMRGAPHHAAGGDTRRHLLCQRARTVAPRRRGVCRATPHMPTLGPTHQLRRPPRHNGQPAGRATSTCCRAALRGPSDGARHALYPWPAHWAGAGL